MKGRTHAEAAAQEAYEEAGLRGDIESRPLGSYQYGKRRMNGRIHLCTVKVFVMPVQSEADHWPEQRERERLWTSPEEAADLVHEPDLTTLLRYLTLESRDLGGHVAVSATRPDDALSSRSIAAGSRTHSDLSTFRLQQVEVPMPAKSASQQKAAGAALSAKRGDTKKSSLKGASREMEKSMSEKELKEMASTKRKGKPEHI